MALVINFGHNVHNDMGSNRISVGLIVCGSKDIEWQVLRATLEVFSVCVIVYLIGRSNAFIDVMNASALSADIDHLIINTHGENGAFALPDWH